jgi:hypothetical protein
VDNAQTGVPTPEPPVIPQSQVPEATCSVRLSERDEAEVLATAENPPAPNEAALRAAKRFLERHGKDGSPVYSAW